MGALIKGILLGATKAAGNLILALLTQRMMEHYVRDLACWAIDLLIERIKASPSTGDDRLIPTLEDMKDTLKQRFP